MAEEPTVSRKVYFFRVEHFAGLKDGLTEALRQIDALSWHSQGRYQQDVSENVFLSVYPDRTNYPLRLRFGRTRRDMLPDVERAGELATLQLEEDAGLIDVCHIIIFPDGHVASEFNHDGPRIRKLGDYLYLKGAHLSTTPRFLPLFERDIVSVLSDLDNIRILEIDVPPDTGMLIRQADNNLADAILASEKAGSTEKVSLELVGNVSAGNKLRDLARKLAILIKDNPRDRTRFNTLKASGYNQGSRIRRFVDILEEQLVSGEIFARSAPKSRSLDSDHAYEVLERAYELKRTKLASAATSNDPW
jgi:hypothetical protein